MLATVLASKGHEVTWWTSDFDHAHKLHRHVPSEVRIQPNLIIRTLQGVGYQKNVSLKRVRHNRSVARSFAAAMQTINNDSHPDVVMVCLHTLELAETVTVYTTSQSIPLVVDVVDIWPDVYLRAFPQALKSVARHCLRSEYSRAKRILQSAYTITAVSSTYLDWALSLCPDAIGRSGVVFPLGYDDADVDDAAVFAESEHLKRAYNISPDTLNLAFVGQLSHSYDLFTVVETARLLYQSMGSRVRFFIAGDGVDRQRLQIAANAVPSIVCTGWLSHPSVVALLRNCSVGLVSYARGATQSLPYKPFEYMAAGLALLSCLPGELAELVRTKSIGIQYTAGSSESLAECIRYLVNNPEHCTSMRQRARVLFETEYRSGTIYSRFTNYLEKIAVGASQHNSTPLT